jgi:deuterolysin
MTHAVAGTDDIIYGCASDQALSDANSIQNADNFNVSPVHPCYSMTSLLIASIRLASQCFTTQVYASTQC